MKIIKAFFFFTAILFSGGVQAQQSLSQKEMGWVPLFNGHDMNDWIVKIHHHGLNENYGSTFRVEDSMISMVILMISLGICITKLLSLIFTLW